MPCVVASSLTSCWRFRLASLRRSVAVAFPGPEVTPVFLALFGLVGEVIGAEPQDDDLPNFKRQVLAWKEYPVARNECQHALVVLWQAVRYSNPVTGHDPLNWGARFSRNAATPSA